MYNIIKNICIKNHFALLFQAPIHHFLFVVLFLTVILKVNIVVAQNVNDYSDYIRKFKDIAISEAARTGIPAAITLAQGIHESSCGKSELAIKSNNHFGIKCHNDWYGKKTYHDDDTLQECFRVYPDAITSFIDHSDFIKNKNRYKPCFQFAIWDYINWAHTLKQCGYATNPKYPQLLIKIIEDHQLYLYDGGKKIFIEKDSAKINITESTNSSSIIDSLNKKKDLAIQHSWNYIRRNNLDAIILDASYTAAQMASLLNLELELLIKNNEILSTHHPLPKNTIIYLEEKNKKCNAKFHIVKNGEDTWQIAQEYGIKQATIYKYNKYCYPSEPRVGEILELQQKRTNTIQFR